MSIFTQTMDSPLGTIRIDASDEWVLGIWFVGQKWEQDQSDSVLVKSNPIINKACKQLGEYFVGTRSVFDLPLGPRGTEFQQSVWREISRIPFGAINSYGSIAHDLTKPKASRAVGAATGRNPISIVIPCHRVLGVGSSAAKQTLTGYAGGLDRKRWLLNHEQRPNRLL